MRVAAQAARRDAGCPRGRTGEIPILRGAQPVARSLVRRPGHMSGRLGDVLRVGVSHRPRRRRQEEDGAQPIGQPASPTRLARPIGCGRLRLRQPVPDGPSRRIVPPDAAHAAGSLAGSFSIGTCSVPFMADSPVFPGRRPQSATNVAYGARGRLKRPPGVGRNRVGSAPFRSASRPPAPRRASPDDRAATTRKRRRRRPARQGARGSARPRRYRPRASSVRRSAVLPRRA